MKPKEFRRGPRGLQVLWSDQKLEVLDYARLRLACHCAVCREMPTHPDYRDARFERARSIHSMDVVGNYAVGITWADGHRSILPFERIRALPPFEPSKVNADHEIESEGCCGGGCHE